MELSGSFKQLVGDHTALADVVNGIQTTIELSFAVDGATITGAEVKRRFQLCEGIFKVLRGDMQWGIARIVDHLPEYLRAELNGETWEPNSRTCWMPKDGR